MLDGPEAMNTLHSPAHAGPGRVFGGFRDDPDTRVGIVSGAGDRAFSAGSDLKYQAAGIQRHALPR